MAVVINLGAYIHTVLIFYGCLLSRFYSIYDMLCELPQTFSIVKTFEKLHRLCISVIEVAIFTLYGEVSVHYTHDKNILRVPVASYPISSFAEFKGHEYMVRIRALRITCTHYIQVHETRHTCSSGLVASYPGSPIRGFRCAKLGFRPFKDFTA